LNQNCIFNCLFCHVTLKSHRCENQQARFYPLTHKSVFPSTFHERHFPFTFSPPVLVEGINLRACTKNKEVEVWLRCRMFA
jgi:hypothetical protein